MSTAVAISPHRRAELLTRIEQVPRIRFAHLPTPLEELTRLRTALGPSAPRIFVKRDDLTGLAFGGNKVRHMEFRLADVLAKGCDTIVVANVAQSNHARLHSALAARFGLTTYILKLPSEHDTPINGNLLLDHLLDAQIVEASSDEPETVARELAALVARLEAAGRRVYNAPNDEFSQVAGTCGYLVGAVELLDQLAALDATVNHLFLASGTSSAGLALAGKFLDAPYRVHPISVSAPRATIEEAVCGYANAVAALIDIPTRLTAADIDVRDDYVGARYGVPTPAGMEALRLVARSEGLILDPVYTGKAFAALLDQIRSGALGPDDTVVFVHSGGLPIVFAYSEEILASLAETAPEQPT